VSLFTVRLFDVVFRFVDIDGFVDHLCLYFFLYEEFGDAKGAIRSRNLKARQHNNQKKKDKKSLKMPKGLSEALLIAHLASSNFSFPFSFGYCVICPSNYGF
jgi:hypothetical protein